jgi:lipid-A-disaccharide synthase
VPRVQFVVARAPNLPESLFEPLTPGARCASPMSRPTDDVLHAADVVVTASGTATVQTALHERPMVIVYRLSPLTYRLGRPFVRVTTFGMANLVAGERIVPELIQDDFTPERVAAETLRFLEQPERRRERARRSRRCARSSGRPGRAGGQLTPSSRCARGKGRAGDAVRPSQGRER